MADFRVLGTGTLACGDDAVVPRGDRPHCDRLIRNRPTGADLGWHMVAPRASDLARGTSLVDALRSLA